MPSSWQATRGPGSVFGRLNHGTDQSENAQTCTRAGSAVLGTGWKPEELSKPQIIVESTFGDSHPGSGHLDKLVEGACKGIQDAGGHGARYYCTDICDGESQGTDGINFSLASREMIANMIEIHANATPFDGGVFIASCDKGMPANLMGLARVNIRRSLLRAEPCGQARNC